MKLLRISAFGALFFVSQFSAAARAQDSWPLQLTTSHGHRALLYQPQIDTFKGDTITGRAAVSLTKKNETTPKFGVVFLTARVSVDRDSRAVSILDLSVARVRFPNIKPENEKKLATLLENEAPKWQLVISYDRLLENLKVAERERKNAEGLRHDPPAILFAQEPTVLVTIEGEPYLREVPGASLKVVVNTPFLIAFDPESRKYFLAGGQSWWYEAAEPRGPWRPIGAPPANVAKLATKTGSSAADGTEKGSAPGIIVATEPTELVVSEGRPTFKPVTGADLLYMDNTESDVLMDVASQDYYVLLSGRWFKSRSLTSGSWTFVSPDALPASFSKISPDSEIGNVLASVPGTDAAEDAVLDAQIPQMTAVERAKAKLDVQFDGEPKFVPIEGTDTEYAVNASAPVLRIRGHYYACDDAVWYVADSPAGPWEVADSVPRDQLDQIPPSAPVYNVKYVSIYDSTPDLVYFGYTPGYLGFYPWYGTVVWGTGWYYPPWIGPRFCWPWPWTWGFGAHYDSSWGWGFGISWSFPFFDIRTGWGDWFPPGGWFHERGRRGPRWWGPGGYRPPARVADRWNRPRRPPSPVRPVLPQRRPVQHERRPGVGFRPGALSPRPDMLEKNIYKGIPGSLRGAPGPVSPGRQKPAPSRSNDVFADRQGDVYRRTKDGQWQRRGTAGWQQPPGAITRPAPRLSPRPDLDRDFGARQRGETRVRSAAPPGRPAASPPRAPAPPRPPAQRPPVRK